jgi:hypothetical protein
VGELREGEREVHGDGGFADAALAAGDGNEVFHAGDGLALRHLLWGWGHGLGVPPRRRKSKSEIGKTGGAQFSGKRMHFAEAETSTD